MSELTGEDRYAERADRAAASASELVRRAPRFAGWLLADAISQTSDRRPVEIAIVGADDAARAELVRTAISSHLQDQSWWLACLTSLNSRCWRRGR